MQVPGPLVSGDWLERHLADPGLRIVDCTVEMLPDANSYRFAPGLDAYRAGHIPGATFIDIIGELQDRDHALPMMMPPPAQFEAVLGAAGVGNEHAVVLYDRGNHAWAARLWLMLRAFGHDNAAVLDGGWQRWTDDGRASETGEASYPAASFRAQPRPELIATRDQVLAAIEDEGTRIIHSLSPDEYRGEVSRYPRPGRITGSVNVFCNALIDPEKKTFLDREALAAKYAPADPDSAERVITYCGGGIAASATALGLAILGHEQVAVYDGSLHEWTADPDLPMETG